jgi:hypothetical protein
VFFSTLIQSSGNYICNITVCRKNFNYTQNKTGFLTESSINASKEANVQKTNFVLVSCDQNAGQNLEIKIGIRSFENVSQFKYLGTTVTNQNLI